MKIDQPSSTALLIARSLLFLSRDDALKHLVPKRRLEASLTLLDGCGVDTWDVLWISKQALFRKAAWALERRLLPGILAHYAV